MLLGFGKSFVEAGRVERQPGHQFDYRCRHVSLASLLPPHSPRNSQSQQSAAPPAPVPLQDRKSTRLNSSHTVISYAVFCLKKKLLAYELHRHGLLAENEKIQPILAQLEKLLLCDLSPSTNDSVKN